VTDDFCTSRPRFLRKVPYRASHPASSMSRSSGSSARLTSFSIRPPHAGQKNGVVTEGGMVPFAVHNSDKLPGDPRPSLEERSGTHDGYVAAVKAVADNAACKGYLFAGSMDQIAMISPRLSGADPGDRPWNVVLRVSALKKRAARAEPRPNHPVDGDAGGADRQNPHERHW
jgi:hypothetical protein